MEQHELKQRRIAAGLSLAQLAERAKCSRAYLHQIESAEARTKRPANADWLHKLDTILTKAVLAKAASEAAAKAIWAS